MELPQRRGASVLRLDLESLRLGPQGGLRGGEILDRSAPSASPSARHRSMPPSLDATRAPRPRAPRRSTAASGRPPRGGAPPRRARPPPRLPFACTSRAPALRGGPRSGSAASASRVAAALARSSSTPAEGPRRCRAARRRRRLAARARARAARTSTALLPPIDEVSQADGHQRRPDATRDTAVVLCADVDALAGESTPPPDRRASSRSSSATPTSGARRSRSSSSTAPSGPSGSRCSSTRTTEAGRRWPDSSP